MKKRIIIISIAIVGIAILALVLGISLKNIIITALTGGVFAFASTGEQKIKKNKQKIKDMEKAKNDQEKEIGNTDYDNYDLANDPVNQLLHKRLELRRNQGNN